MVTVARMVRLLGLAGSGFPARWRPRGRARPARARRQRGVVLVVVMVLLLILGLSAASALRGAVSGERFADNLRRQQLAEQQAEIALRYCEAELRKPDGTETDLPPGLALRVPSLAEDRLARTEWNAPPAWREPASWTGVGAASASRTQVPQAQAGDHNGGASWGRKPECVVEMQRLADGALVHVVTARGFSPGGGAQAGSDSPGGGVVAWLQSTVLLGPDHAAPTCPEEGQEAAAVPPEAVDAHAAQAVRAMADLPGCASEEGDDVDAGAGAGVGAGRRIHDRLWRRILHPPVP